MLIEEPLYFFLLSLSAIKMRRGGAKITFLGIPMCQESKLDGHLYIRRYDAGNLLYKFYL